MKTLRSLFTSRRAKNEATDAPQRSVPAPSKPGPTGTQMMFSLPAALSQWLRSYAYNAGTSESKVAAAALAHAKTRAVVPQYREPGTSVTRRAVAEVEITLAPTDAKWLLDRAAQDQVSHCAVFHAVLSNYQEVAPANEDDTRRVYITGQELFYKQITATCEEVAAGQLSAEEADFRLADAVAVRMYHLLPEVDRTAVRAAAQAAIRELCMNHPALRQAHGRENTPDDELLGTPTLIT